MTVVFGIVSIVEFADPLFSSWFHSPGPKKAINTVGRMERGELKMTSLISDEIVSKENHLNEISPVSFLILYGLSPRQTTNV